VVKVDEMALVKVGKMAVAKISDNGSTSSAFDPKRTLRYLSGLRFRTHALYPAPDCS
jgi:hypothetical protein